MSAAPKISSPSEVDPLLHELREMLKRSAITATHPETGVSLEFVWLGTALTAVDTLLQHVRQEMQRKDDHGAGLQMWHPEQVRAVLRLAEKANKDWRWALDQLVEATKKEGR